jgi:2-octaprenylphenol hydroxylase
MKQLEFDSNNLTGQLWDIVIVGGGMVGAATALGLSKNGFKVLILEKGPVNLDWDHSSEYRMRVSALTRASEKILKNLGVWTGIENRRCHAFTAMHVWDEVTPGEVHFSAKDIQEPNLGHTVENAVIQAAIWEQLEQQDNVSVLYTAEISDVETSEQQAHLRLVGDVCVKTQLLIAADGAFSKVRELANIGLKTHDYQQCAIVGCVKTESSHQDTCWQRYTGDGPFAFLAMDENVSSIAWYLPNEKMDWALSLDDETFAEEISRASDYRLGQVVEVAQRDGFPLVRRHAEHYVKPHLALVGDAAHTIHPQAGQGVNLGLLDAAALIEKVVEARDAGKDFGSYSVLRKYERWRRGDNEIVQRSMEAFDWLFKQDASLKVAFRKFMLPVANRMSFVKNWLMDQALNGRESLPELAKRVLSK